MTRILLTGMVAGAAAALLYALPHIHFAIWVTPFVHLAPLPIMIVALGWSHWAGLVAAAAASALVAGMSGTGHADALFVGFLAVIGGPAWWLGYLAMLGRPIANGGGSAQVEWYPPGRLVLWAAVLGAAAGALAVLWGPDDTVRTNLKALVEAILRHARDAKVQVPPEFDGSGGADAIADAVLQLLPTAKATIATLDHAFNLWLAGHAVRLVGRLQRPWPDLTALSFPAWVAALYGASLASMFLPGVPGVVASVLAAPLTAAFVMVGFAVVHAVTRGVTGRAVLLWSLYLSTLVLASPALVMTILGVTETLFDLRARFSRRGPPAATGA
jgi:hypothetical protein